MFKNNWINANSKLSSPCITNVTPSHLTYDEESALWYVAGYLIRSLDKKIEKSRYIHKEEMLQTLHNFVEDKEAHSHEEFASSAWFNSINRGGLTRCSNDFYYFIYAVEESLKTVLQLVIKEIQIPKLIEQLRLDANIHQTWTTLCSSADVITEQYIYDELLTEILNFYIQIRGYAFTTKWMEDLKKKQKKSLQKSKSLRNKIQNTDMEL